MEQALLGGRHGRPATGKWRRQQVARPGTRCGASLVAAGASSGRALGHPLRHTRRLRGGHGLSGRQRESPGRRATETACVAGGASGRGLHRATPVLFAGSSTGLRAGRVNEDRQRLIAETSRARPRKPSRRYSALESQRYFARVLEEAKEGLQPQTPATSRASALEAIDRTLTLVSPAADLYYDKQQDLAKLQERAGIIGGRAGMSSPPPTIQTAPANPLRGYKVGIYFMNGHAAAEAHARRVEAGLTKQAYMTVQLYPRDRAFMNRSTCPRMTKSATRPDPVTSSGRPRHCSAWLATRGSGSSTCAWSALPRQDSSPFFWRMASGARETHKYAAPLVEEAGQIEAGQAESPHDAVERGGNHRHHQRVALGVRCRPSFVKPLLNSPFTSTDAE